MIDNCADDWRIAMTWQRMMQIGERQGELLAKIIEASLVWRILSEETKCHFIGKRYSRKT